MYKLLLYNHGLDNPVTIRIKSCQVENKLPKCKHRKGKRHEGSPTFSLESIIFLYVWIIAKSIMNKRKGGLEGNYLIILREYFLQL